MITSFERYDNDVLLWLAGNLRGLVHEAALDPDARKAPDAPPAREIGAIFAPLRERVEAELLRRGVDVEPLLP